MSALSSTLGILLVHALFQFLQTGLHCGFSRILGYQLLAKSRKMCRLCISRESFLALAGLHDWLSSLIVVTIYQAGT
jgi:hypothetical protein